MIYAKPANVSKPLAVIEGHARSDSIALDSRVRGEQFKQVQGWFHPKSATFGFGANREELLDNIASTTTQPPLPPTLLIGLLRHIFSHPQALKACDGGMGITETIEYLEQLEAERVKRIKALERRGAPLGAEFVNSSPTIHKRYDFVLTGIKLWVRCLLVRH